MAFLNWLQNDTAGLLTLAAVSVALLLVLIMRLRLEPFIALIVTGVLVALVAGVSVTELVGTRSRRRTRCSRRDSPGSSATSPRSSAWAPCSARSWNAPAGRTR